MMTKSLYCVRAQDRELPMYDGLTIVDEFMTKFESAARAPTVWCVKMDIARDTCAMVGHPWRNFRILAQLQVHDANKIWEARTTNNGEIWWMWWSTHAPYQMDQILWRGASTRLVALIFSYPRCHPKELVYWNRASTWHRRVGYLAWRVFVDIPLWRPMDGYRSRCVTAGEGRKNLY